MDCKPQHQECPQSNLSQAVRGADGQPLAQVMQPDAERNQEGDRQSALDRVCARRHSAADGNQDQHRDHQADEYQPHALKSGGQRAGRLERIMDGLHSQEQQQPRGQAEEEGDPSLIQLAQEREPQQPQQHGDDSHIDAEQGKRRQVPGIHRRGCRGDLDGVLKRKPGRRNQLEVVRLPLHPRVGHRDDGLAEPRHRVTWRHRELPVRFVDHYLRHCHRLGPAVGDVDGHHLRGQ